MRYLVSEKYRRRRVKFLKCGNYTVQTWNPVSPAGSSAGRFTQLSARVDRPRSANAHGIPCPVQRRRAQPTPAITKLVFSNATDRFAAETAGCVCVCTEGKPPTDLCREPLAGEGEDLCCQLGLIKNLRQRILPRFISLRIQNLNQLLARLSTSHIAYSPHLSPRHEPTTCRAAHQRRGPSLATHDRTKHQRCSRLSLSLHRRCVCVCVCLRVSIAAAPGSALATSIFVLFRSSCVQQLPSGCHSPSVAPAESHQPGRSPLNQDASTLASRLVPIPPHSQWGTRSSRAAVVKSLAPTDVLARDRRASSAIALLEGHSWVVPYPDELSSDLEEDADEDQRTTENTSANGYSAMMATPSLNVSEPRPQINSSTNHTASSSSSHGSEKNNSWIARFRVIEFSISILMIAMAGVLALISVHMRDIPNVEVKISSTQIIYARDPTINNKMMDQQVSMVALVIGATGAPILANLFINYVLPKFKRVRMIPHDTRDFLLSLAQSVGISQVLTQFVKNMTGRFRPCFYDMCKWNYDVVWDGKTNLCQDEKWEKEGRRSFPSGHSSYAWCTLFLMTLYLMGRSRLNCENRDETLLRGGRKTLKLFLCFLPTLVAAWVAVTRSVDNWHHYTDIVTGSIIGAFAAGFGYSYNYGSIFNWESAGVPHQEVHVRRKKKDLDMQDPNRSLLNATMELDTDARSPHSHSHSSTSYTTANPPKSSDTISISIK